VDEIFEGVQPDQSRVQFDQRRRIQITIRQQDEIKLVSLRLADATSLGTKEFCRASTMLYSLLWDVAGQTYMPSRVWNYLPGIGAQMEPGLNRYMAFNLGRHDALMARYGEQWKSSGWLPTATGVGHQGSDLVIHALLTSTPPIAIENHRQRPTFQYSNRFGPLPPCFSRACIADIGGVRQLLIAGTASIRGERTMHIGEFGRQVDEIFENISALITSSIDDATGSFGSLRSARVYVHPHADTAMAQREVGPRLGHCVVEWISAEFCRSDLLIEIEGVVVPRANRSSFLS